MDLGLDNKVVFIGASSKGLGKAVAIALANEGAQVIINGRNRKTLLETQNEIELVSNRKVLAVQGDLSSEVDRNQIFREVFKKFPAIDILVTNTGGPPAGNFESFDKKDWDEAYELLVGSAVELITAFLPMMKEKKWGRIITISSVAVKQPVDNLILSNSIRSSIIGLVKSLSNELGQYNITVNNVMPGYTNTERLQNLLKSDEMRNKIIEGIPLNRVGEPEEFAAAVAFLCSKKASYITGVSLAVDGGVIKGV